MKLSEARKLWKHYVWQWKENVISGPGEWARELFGRDLKIDRLKTKLSEYTKLADIHEENQDQLIEEVKKLEKRVSELTTDLGGWLQLARRWYLDADTKDPKRPRLAGVNTTERILNVPLTEARDE